MTDAQPGTIPKKATHVLIGCKLSNGFWMEVCNLPPRDPKEQTLQPPPQGPRILIKGANSLRTDRRAAQGSHPYAVTRVPIDHWEAWLRQNKDRAYVKNGLVFVAKDKSDAKAIAKERKDVRTGTEALAQEKDPRLPQGKVKTKVGDFEQPSIDGEHLDKLEGDDADGDEEEGERDAA